MQPKEESINGSKKNIDSEDMFDGIPIVKKKQKRESVRDQVDNLKVQVLKTFLKDGKEEDEMKKNLVEFKEETSKRIGGLEKSLEEILKYIKK